MFNSGVKKFDHILIGTIVGLIVPITIMKILLSYYSNFDFKFLLENPMFSGVINNLKGCLFANLGVFFIFYWLKKDKSARGVILATLLYCLIYLFYMIFG